MKIHVSLVITGYKNKTANVTPQLHINEHNKNKIMMDLSLDLDLVV